MGWAVAGSQSILSVPLPTPPLTTQQSSSPSDNQVICLLALLVVQAEPSPILLPPTEARHLVLLVVDQGALGAHEVLQGVLRIQGLIMEEVLQ